MKSPFDRAVARHIQSPHGEKQHSTTRIGSIKFRAARRVQRVEAESRGRDAAFLVTIASPDMDLFTFPLQWGRGPNHSSLVSTRHYWKNQDSGLEGENLDYELFSLDQYLGYHVQTGMPNSEPSQIGKLQSDTKTKRMR